MCKYRLIIGLSLLPLFGFAEQFLDPTRPLEYIKREAAEQSLTLHSILVASGRKVAIINGKRLKEKDWLGDKQVIHISSQRVVLSHRGQDIVLRLHNSDIRQ